MHRFQEYLDYFGYPILPKHFLTYPLLDVDFPLQIHFIYLATYAAKVSILPSPTCTQSTHSIATTISARYPTKALK